MIIRFRFFLYSHVNTDFSDEIFYIFIHSYLIFERLFSFCFKNHVKKKTLKINIILLCFCDSQPFKI